MGAHTANPSSGDFSVTSSSILKVENGEVVGALKQAGLSGNLAQALSGEVLLGSSVRRQGSYSSGSMHLPDVLLKDGLRKSCLIAQPTGRILYVPSSLVRCPMEVKGVSNLNQPARKRRLFSVQATNINAWRRVCFV